MPNIFLESHNIKNLHFGFGQFNYHLIKSLSKLDFGHLNLTLHASNLHTLKQEFSDTFNYKKYYSLRRYPFFRIRKKYDLWHSLNQNITIEPYYNIPYLLTVHNTSHIKNPENYKSEKNHIKFQEKLMRSDAITYISEFAKASTHRFFDVPNVPEFVIYNGNPIPNITLKEDDLPLIKSKKPFLFTIGEITERKNFESLIPLIHLLKDYNLIIAGRNNTKAAESIRASINKYNLNDRVLLVGKISETDKQYYYKNCEAFVFPSLREGFGLPVIEAMKFEKPVFASNNTSLPEIGGDLAFYWNNYDPEYMLNVFENGMNKFQNQKEDYKLKMKERASSFNWDTAAKQYLNVYKTLTQ